jgi:hypothetical protein
MEEQIQIIDQIAPEDLEYFQPAIQAWGAANQALAQAQASYTNAEAALNFILALLRSKAKYALKEADQIDEDGRITRASQPGTTPDPNNCPGCGKAGIETTTAGGGPRSFMCGDCAKEWDGPAAELPN